MPSSLQLDLIAATPPLQLLKWVGNKQRYAIQIARVFENDFCRYIEPFVGSGAILGALAPENGLAGDTLRPLIDLWKLVQRKPQDVVDFYSRTWKLFIKDRSHKYLQIRESYNCDPNPLDLLFLSRSCYGGVVRFTKEGRMSTPIGIHTPIPPDSFESRLLLWRDRIKNTEFVHAGFTETMSEGRKGDLIYCDPPYVYCQSILYGAQSFNLETLWVEIERCVAIGAKVALSIDGSKKSGRLKLDVGVPPGLFKREVAISCGRSMLRRFQKKGETLEEEHVSDRLLLTW